MSHIWTFSQVSQGLLQQCLDAAHGAARSDEHNKWLQQFGTKNLKLIENLDNIVIMIDSPEVETIAQQVNQEENTLNVIEELMDPDFDIISKFNYFQEVCRKSPDIVTKLAQNLPINTVEKLIHHVFDTKDLNNEFLNHFFKYFLPVYIKKENSRLCTDLLFKTSKLYPDYLKIVLKVTLKDLEIQNNIINDFISLLSASEQTEFLNNITNIELTGEEFSHNLFNIFTAYKGCNKTENTQNHIFSLLKTHSQFCTIDKNYGKLLLSYLQQEKCLKKEIDTLVIEEIIENHKSPFKRPCLAVLKEINGC